MHEDLWRRMKRVLERHGQEFMDKSTIKPPYIDMSTYFQSSLPLTLHLSMFRLTMENLANDEQKAKWMPLINNIDIIGCYA